MEEATCRNERWADMSAPHPANAGPKAPLSCSTTISHCFQGPAFDQAEEYACQKAETCASGKWVIMASMVLTGCGHAQLGC